MSDKITSSMLTITNLSYQKATSETLDNQKSLANLLQLFQ